MRTRPQRVQEQIRREISLIVHNEVKDPRLGFVTITRVEISKDLKNAAVYYSVLNEKEVKNTGHALSSAGGYIKGLIGERLKLRFVPNIEFKVDKSMDHTRKIYEILDKIKSEENKTDVHREDDRGGKKV